MKQMRFSRVCLDESVRPQDDFYQYAMGGFLKKHTIPATEACWGMFHMLRKQVRTQLQQIAETAAQKRVGTKEEQLVGAMYRSALDEARRKKLGTRPIQALLAEVEGLTDTASIERFIARAHKEGIDVLWAPFVGRDDRRSEWNTLHLSQSGLSLPDRDYYLNDDAESKRVRDAFLRYIPKLLTHFGYGKKERETIRDAVVRIETELAKASMTMVERRNPHALYNRRTVSALAHEAPGINWAQYLKRIGAGKVKILTVCQPVFMRRVGEMLGEIPVSEWQAYLAWSVINELSSSLTPELTREVFRFYGTTLTGTKKMRPLPERAVGAVDAAVGDALGKLYVREHFTPATKKRMDTLVDHIFSATKKRIKALSWMSPATKKKALAKLANIKRKIGYPTRWESYAGLDIRSDDYFGNVRRAHAHHFRRMMRRIDKKAEAWRWYMPPQTVNAYYDPTANEIAFPAGILQPPFFDPAADDAMNYGMIGSVIGHEITHAFDDEGRKFDAKGNLKDWWTKEDASRFVKRADVLRAQYDVFVAIDGVRVNGSLTLGENIADLGGLLIGLDAFLESQKGKNEELIDGFTPLQRFFIGLAVFEATNYRPAYLKQMVATDPHSPASFRVNGPMPHIDAFYDAFNIQPGDALYIPPAKRARIW